jgi:hypothetical protein
LHLRDFESYYAAGAAFLHGDDPYSPQLWIFERSLPGVNPAHEELLPFVGPPFGLHLWGALAHLPWGAACIVWAAVLAAASVFLVLATLRLVDSNATWMERVAAFALAIGFAPLTAGLALGQAAIPASAAVVGSVLAARARAPLGIFAGALIAMLQPNLAILLVSQLRERRTALALIAAAAVALLLSLLAGESLAESYASNLLAHARSESLIGIQMTPAAVAYAFGASPPTALALGGALTVAVVGAIVLQLASRRYDPVAGSALACAALPLALPFSHEADLAIVFFPALLCLRRARGALRWVAIAGTLLVAVDWLDLAQRTTPLPTLIALALCAALGAIALATLSRAPLRPPSSSHRRFGGVSVTAFAVVPLASVAIVALTGLLVARHPMPVWPDALPAGFHATARGERSSANVWALEQRASGLAVADPVWGALRLASLSGCALLWFAGSLTLNGRRDPIAEAGVSEPESPRWGQPSTPRRRRVASGPSC